MNNLIYILPLIIFFSSLITYLYLDYQKKKSFIIAGGCTIGIITVIMVISAVCSILQFFWFIYQSMFY